MTHLFFFWAIAATIIALYLVSKLREMREQMKINEYLIQDITEALEIRNKQLEEIQNLKK